MQHIPKNTDNEPTDFQNWKVRKAEKHDPLGNIAVWEDFRADTRIKEVVQEALLKEQGYICCYCCSEIDESTISIEHFNLKSICPKTDVLNFQNLLASCKRKGNCNEKRNDKNLSLNPCQEEAVSQVYFERKGRYIHLKSDNPIFQQEIDKVLNLNHSGFGAARNAKIEEIKEVIAKLETEGLLKEKEDWQDLYQQFTEKENGKYPHFAPLALWHLKKFEPTAK
jgi:uncharacterized protein (TIGR02646 family)